MSTLAPSSSAMRCRSRRGSRPLAGDATSSLSPARRHRLHTCISRINDLLVLYQFTISLLSIFYLLSFPYFPTSFLPVSHQFPISFPYQFPTSFLSVFPISFLSVSYQLPDSFLSVCPISFLSLYCQFPISHLSFSCVFIINFEQDLGIRVLQGSHTMYAAAVWRRWRGGGCRRQTSLTSCRISVLSDYEETDCKLIPRAATGCTPVLPVSLFNSFVSVDNQSLIDFLHEPSEEVSKRRLHRHRLHTSRRFRITFW